LAGHVAIAREISNNWEKYAACYHPLFTMFPHPRSQIQRLQALKEVYPRGWPKHTARNRLLDDKEYISAHCFAQNPKNVHTDRVCQEHLGSPLKQTQATPLRYFLGWF